MVTLLKRSFGRVGGRKPRRGGGGRHDPKKLFAVNLALPEKLALWLVLRPSQLRWEGNGGGDQREVS